MSTLQLNQYLAYPRRDLKDSEVGCEDSLANEVGKLNLSIKYSYFSKEHIVDGCTYLLM